MRSKAHSALTAPLVLYIIQGFTNALWKSSVSMAKCGMNFFFIVIYHSSLVKAAVNGLHIFKLRRDRLTGTGHGTTVFVAPLEYATTSHHSQKSKRRLKFQVRNQFSPLLSKLMS
jgi:hypothetical protein